MNYGMSTTESAIYNKFVSYNYTGFLHMTDRDHAREILKSGFLGSREYEKGRDFGFQDNANQSVIGITDEMIKQCARLYMYKGTPTYYNFEKDNPSNMVLFSFNWNVIKLDGAFITDGNPACIPVTKVMPASDFLNSDGSFLDYDRVFHRRPLPMIYKSVYEMNCEEYEMYEMRRDILRKRNAELDIPGTVPLLYLDKIIFKTQEDYDSFWSDERNKKLGHGYKFRSVVDGSYYCL